MLRRGASAVSRACSHASDSTDPAQPPLPAVRTASPTRTDVTSTRRPHNPGCRSPTSPIAATSTVERSSADDAASAFPPVQPTGPPPVKNATQWLVPLSEDSHPVVPAVLRRGLDEVQERR